MGRHLAGVGQRVRDPSFRDFKAVLFVGVVAGVALGLTVVDAEGDWLVLFAVLTLASGLLVLTVLIQACWNLWQFVSADAEQRDVLDAAATAGRRGIEATAGLLLVVISGSLWVVPTIPETEPGSSFAVGFLLIAFLGVIGLVLLAILWPVGKFLYIRLDDLFREE